MFDGFDDDMTFTLTLKRSEVSGHAGAIHLAKTYDRELRDDMQYTSYLKVPQLVIGVLGHKQANVLDLGVVF